MNKFFGTKVVIPLVVLCGGLLFASNTKAGHEGLKGLLKHEKSGPTEGAEVSAQSAVTQIYASPGIASLQNGQWVGQDHLYNLTNQIGVYLEFSQPPGVQLTIDEAAIRVSIEQALRKAGIEPRADILGSNQGPLPFLHFIVVMNPQESGPTAAFCACRLFESVFLDRVRLDKGISWQVITWEDENLLLIPTDQLQKTLLSELTDFATAFGTRYTYFRALKGN